jgi:hypothetical protein
MIKAIMVPIEVVSPIASFAPYQTIKAVEMAAIISTTGKNIE